MPIRYSYFEIGFRLKNITKTNQWIFLVTNREKKTVKEIRYVFCSDQHLLSLNKEYLNHDTLTDILTFNYAPDSESLVGDIYISIDRVRENASIFNVSFADELDRVMIHGVLHLIGYNDLTKTDKRLMQEKENTYLSLKKNHNLSH